MAFGQILGYIGMVTGGVIGGVIGSIFPGIGTVTGITIGASLGGMIGGIAGQVFYPELADLNLPPPPQPHEARAQVSTYGAPIPIVYESARLAGNIIYMQDINQTVTRTSHRQDGVRYYEITSTYASTFAVAFCEGPVTGICRIWVNHKVFADFRDPSGPYYPTGSIGLATANLATSIARNAVYFTTYLGTESQTADPTLVSLLTDAETPAYRGICYIVFIDFPVGEFSGLPLIEVEIGDALSIESVWKAVGDYSPGKYWRVYNCRVMVTVSRNLSYCRFLFNAHQTETTYITKASVGLRVGTTPDFNGAPTKITFSGADNVTIAAGGSVWSDTIPYTMTTDNNYLVHIYQYDSAGYIYSPRYVNTDTEGFYYNTTNSDQTFIEDVTMFDIHDATEYLVEIEGY